MKRKKIVVALGHKALGTTLPEQKAAVKRSAKVIADLVAAGADVVITHSNAPQVGMIHMAMNEFGKMHTDYSAAPMSVCSAMSEGYIGYDLQNAIRAELLRRGIFKTTSTILTQVEVDPYDDAFNNPVKLIGRTLTKEEADAEEEKGNYVTKTEEGYRRIVAAPKPQDIVEIDSIRLLLDAGQVVIAAGGGGIPVLPQNEELKGASAVIEKDLTSGLMAEMLNADMLMILTSVENVPSTTVPRTKNRWSTSPLLTRRNTSQKASSEKTPCCRRWKQLFLSSRKASAVPQSSLPLILHSPDSREKQVRLSSNTKYTKKDSREWESFFLLFFRTKKPD